MTNWYDPTPEDINKLKRQETWLSELKEKFNNHQTKPNE
tara:strand:- start:1951 stop:2067 length:117 start_codon:yes stop_codon:yes gene_type:complete